MFNNFLLNNVLLMKFGVYARMGDKNIMSKNQSDRTGSYGDTK